MGIMVHDVEGTGISDMGIEMSTGMESIEIDNTDKNGMSFYDGTCYGDSLSVNVSRKGYCKKGTMAWAPQEIKIEMKAEAALYLTVQNDENASIVTNLKLEFKVKNTGKIKHYFTNSQGMAICSYLCQGDEVEVTVTSGQECTGSHVYYIVGEGANE